MMYFVLTREDFDEDFFVNSRHDTIEEAREYKDMFEKAGFLVTIVMEVE